MQNKVAFGLAALSFVSTAVMMQPSLASLIVLIINFGLLTSLTLFARNH